MKAEIHNLLIEKAKTRKNGVYSYQAYLYIVKNKSFVAYADYGGTINGVRGPFHYQIGKCERHDRKKRLVEYLKKLE